MSIEIKNVSKQFGNFQALRDVNLAIDSGELIALLGPSGCGKTTLLRIIAGLESADEGSVLFAGEDATDLHARDRQVGFVFQHYALFRHMTVFENVAFGLRVKRKADRPSEVQIKEKVVNLLHLVQLGWLADRYPSKLSGGQRQRIALARALAVEPKVLLLDEPFGALDAKVRKELRRWLRRLHDDLHVTTIFVTHDQEEALEVSDRVVLMNSGQIEQVGTPNDVWEHPATSFVYGFLGNVNLFHGRAYKGEMSVGGIQIPTPEHQGSETRRAQAYVRPHELQIDRYVEGGSGIDSKIHRTTVAGPIARVELNTQDRSTEGVPEIIEVQLLAEEYRDLGFQEGDRVLVYPKRAKVFVE